MLQLEEENLRLKRLVADLSLDKAMLQDVLAKRAHAGTPARMGQGFTGPVRCQSVLRYGSAAARSGIALWHQTTAHFACARLLKPGCTTVTAGYT